MSSLLHTTIIAVVAIIPFWILAARLDDGDEFLKTGIGAGLIGVLTLVFRFLEKTKKNGQD